MTRRLPCSKCGRLVRVRRDGSLYQHLAVLATPTHGSVVCTGGEPVR